MNFLTIEVRCMFNTKFSNGSWTEWSTIQEVIGRVISNRPSVARGRFEITSKIP